MIKLVALYTHPDNEEEFMDHYLNEHTPLVKKTPGLAQVEITRITGNAFGGEAPYYLMCVMSYPDQQTFDAAMRSPENQAVVKDVMGFAKDLVTVVVGSDVQ